KRVPGLSTLGLWRRRSVSHPGRSECAEVQTAARPQSSLGHVSGETETGLQLTQPWREMRVMRHNGWAYAVVIAVWSWAEAGGAAAHLAASVDDSSPAGSRRTAAVEKSFPVDGIGEVQI